MHGGVLQTLGESGSIQGASAAGAGGALPTLAQPQPSSWCRVAVGQ